MKKIDILLPIYNSYDEVKNCIESVIKYTNPDSYNLFLLDDNSPDSKIQKLTDFYSKKYAHIFVHKNKKNLGFPGNVNNGFDLSSNDVVILNSDTLVSSQWLEHLKRVAYSEGEIVAVNPLSNYGIISGLPTLNMEINDLFNYEEIITSFQSAHIYGYIEAPTLIGFCMYIKRRALTDVGYFDAETFKKGYGEETDWCMRAREKGFRLAISKESYVHHIGGTSFGIEKEKLRESSREILLQRYPYIDSELKTFVKKNELRDIRMYMLKELKAWKKGSSTLIKAKIFRHYLLNNKF